MFPGDIKFDPYLSCLGCVTNIFTHKCNSNLGRGRGEETDREVLDGERRKVFTSLTQQPGEVTFPAVVRAGISC